MAELELGYDVPARPGQRLDEICTPALIIDLDALDRNAARMKRYCPGHGIRLRAHAKTHKSADIARYLIEHGGACGICCQKLSEAEAMIRGGITDVFLTNIVADPVKIARLAALSRQARIIVCVDDIRNAQDLAAAAAQAETVIECVVEIEAGHMICGIPVGPQMLQLAQNIDATPGLKFGGIQAYQGLAQHTYDYAGRAALMETAIDRTRTAVDMLSAAGLTCGIIGGGGTGTHPFETASGVYNELQCGSYIFMDADYFRVKEEDGSYISSYEPSLFICTSVISTAKPGRAICDAGLKAQSGDSGLPQVHPPASFA
jgi:3-hydroxy-D-aspartate aldolase